MFEYLNMGGQASSDKSELMGIQLARMHRRLSPNGMYGFDIDNTIGGEPESERRGRIFRCVRTSRPSQRGCLILTSEKA